MHEFTSHETGSRCEAGASARRLRRLRGSASLRALRREHHLRVDQLVQPIFVVERESDAGPVPSMPGVMRHALASIPEAIDSIAKSGVRSVLLFGVPATKDEQGSSAWDEEGVVPRAVRLLKRAAPGVTVMTDVCLCAYTTHGHCGLVDGGRVLNDESLVGIARMAEAHAAAGADIVAPSCMFDGAVAAIRASLDGGGHGDVGILAYAVKYASAFYGPFRDAAGSSPRFGDRRTHQMDPANGDEALAEAGQDLAEGADILMVKPGLPCLDVVRRLHEAFVGVPIAAYQVSGEYSSLVAAAERGWIDLRSAALESLVALRRAGAGIIVTYFADRVGRWLDEAEAGS
ncbi:MAG: porphobilinogen synthase [Phycisphaerae bacterium]|jgi:porphobilinogen synthase|nr:porphobilinogen synthase [Phycisphaerae bacterium]